MNKYKRIKEKAIELRNAGSSLEEIVNNLKLPKGTIYQWIKTIPLQREKIAPNIEKMNKARKDKLVIEYERAYNAGNEEFAKNKDKFFRDLILIFLTEGYRKSKNSVEIINSNPKIIGVCETVLKKYTTNIRHQLHYHEDRDLNKLLYFWSNFLKIDASSIRTQIKVGNLSNRSEACEYGVMHLQVHDYKLRHMMQAWMDNIEKEWSSIC